MEIHEVEPGDFVIVMEGVMEISRIEGVNPDGSLRPDKEGGVSIITVEGFAVSMREALSFLRRSSRPLAPEPK